MYALRRVVSCSIFLNVSNSLFESSRIDVASPKFNAQKMCASLCLQHKVNETLDNYVKGKVKIKKSSKTPPDHINFI